MTGARLDDRRRAELRSKLASIGAEFEHWRAASAKGAPLRKHNSQIARTTEALAGLVARIEQDLDDAKGAAVLGRSEKVERSVLDLHRMWDYFRSKLALRYVTWFQQPLYAVDELAWGCYEPVQQAVAPALRARLKEPPLTFFNGAWSPYAAARGRAYTPEAVEGALLGLVSAHDAIRKLPIPVVGVPWYLAQHLPDSPVVCHEVGHAVEDDFGIEGEVAAALDAAMDGADVPEERRDAWRCWRGEVFADVYGCLGAGPAFLSALMGFLAADPDAVTLQRLSSPGWGKYPTTPLRVALNLETLRRLDHEEPAEELRERWEAFYDVDDAMPTFRKDVEVVAGALLEARFEALGDRRLQDVLSFDRVRQDKANMLAKGLLVKKAPDPSDVRVAHAAARLAFDADPEKFVDAGAGPRTLGAIWDARDEGVRRGAPARPLEELAEADRRLGSELYDAMSEAEEDP
jgi:hypothetical protein